MSGGIKCCGGGHTSWKSKINIIDINEANQSLIQVDKFIRVSEKSIR